MTRPTRYGPQPDLEAAFARGKKLAEEVRTHMEEKKEAPLTDCHRDTAHARIAELEAVLSDWVAAYNNAPWHVEQACADRARALLEGK